MPTDKHPLAIAWESWLASPEGQAATAAHTLPRSTSQDADNQFLENRLRNAFDAGVNAERELILDRATRMWEKITEGIKA